MTIPSLAAIVGILVCLTGCSKKQDDAEKTTSLAAWAECMFELDKIEVTRGRNLDDLNKGHMIARNQFLVDCMGAKHAVIQHEQMLNLAAYPPKGNAPSDMNLNNGKR